MLVFRAASFSPYDRLIKPDMKRRYEVVGIRATRRTLLSPRDYPPM